jgi:hypothetical protein
MLTYNVRTGIRFNPSIGMMGTAGGINSAILRYAGANETIEPNTSYTPSNPLFEGDLVVCVGALKFAAFFDVKSK